MNLFWLLKFSPVTHRIIMFFRVRLKCTLSLTTLGLPPHPGSFGSSLRVGPKSAWCGSMWFEVWTSSPKTTTDGWGAHLTSCLWRPTLRGIISTDILTFIYGLKQTRASITPLYVGVYSVRYVLCSGIFGKPMHCGMCIFWLQGGFFFFFWVVWFSIQ